MQYIRCFNEQCEFYLSQRCTQGLVTVDETGKCLKAAQYDGD